MKKNLVFAALLWSCFQGDAMNPRGMHPGEHGTFLSREEILSGFSNLYEQYKSGGIDAFKYLAESRDIFLRKDPDSEWQAGSEFNLDNQFDVIREEAKKEDFNRHLRAFGILSFSIGNCTLKVVSEGLLDAVLNLYRVLPDYTLNGIDIDNVVEALQRITEITDSDTGESPDQIRDRSNLPIINQISQIGDFGEEKLGIDMSSYDDSSDVHSLLILLSEYAKFYLSLQEADRRNEISTAVFYWIREICQQILFISISS